MKERLALAGVWLERWRPAWIGLLALSLVSWGGRFLVWSLLIAGLFWLWAGWGSRVWGRRTPLDWPWLIWLSMLPVSLWASAAPDLTRPALAMFLAQALAFWGLVAWVGALRRAGWAAAGLSALAASLAVLAPFWLARGDLPADWLPWPLRQAVNENVLAGVLVGLWPLALAWQSLVLPPGRGRTAAYLAGLLAAIAILAALLLTRSAGAWLAAAWAGLFLLALRWRWLWLAAAGLLLLAALASPYWLPGLPAQATPAGAAVDWAGRLEIWSRAFYALQDFAFTGIGLGSFPRVIPLLYPFFTFAPDVQVPHAHTLALQVGLDLGLPGLIAFLAMTLATAALVGRALGRWRSQGRRDPARLLAGAAAGLSAVWLHGLVDAASWNTRPAFLLWALWGLTVSLAMLAGAESGALGHARVEPIETG